MLSILTTATAIEIIGTAIMLTTTIITIETIIEIGTETVIGIEIEAEGVGKTLRVAALLPQPF